MIYPNYLCWSLFSHHNWLALQEITASPDIPELVGDIPTDLPDEGDQNEEVEDAGREISPAKMGWINGISRGWTHFKRSCFIISRLVKVHIDHTVMIKIPRGG